jgi:hypothetical protein
MHPGNRLPVLNTQPATAATSPLLLAPAQHRQQADEQGKLVPHHRHVYCCESVTHEQKKKKKYAVHNKQLHRVEEAVRRRSSYTVHTQLRRNERLAIERLQQTDVMDCQEPQLKKGSKRTLSVPSTLTTDGIGMRGTRE